MRGTFAVLGVLVVVFVIGIFALLCAPMLILGLASVAARHQAGSASELHELRSRILAFVDEQSGDDQVTWAELESANVVTRQDRRLCRNKNTEYRPISANSPDDAIVFDPMGLEGTRYYKKSAGMLWRSPNRDILMIQAVCSQSGGYAIEFRNERTGNLLLSFEPDANIDVTWRRDSGMVAIEDGYRGGGSHVHVFVVRPDEVIEVELPAEVKPESFLDEYEASFRHTWSQARTEFDSWDGELLKVDSHGWAWIRRADDEIIGRVSFIYRSSIRVRPDLGTEVVSVEEVERRRGNKNGWPLRKFAGQPAPPLK